MTPSFFSTGTISRATVRTDLDRLDVSAAIQGASVTAS
jgi:hypothetical protein